MSRDQKLQTSVSNFKKNFQLGTNQLLSNEEFGTVTHVANCGTDKYGEPQPNTLMSINALKYHFSEHLNHVISV